MNFTFSYLPHFLFIEKKYKFGYRYLHGFGDSSSYKIDVSSNFWFLIQNKILREKISKMDKCRRDESCTFREGNMRKVNKKWISLSHIYLVLILKSVILCSYRGGKKVLGSDTKIFFSTTSFWDVFYHRIEQHLCNIELQRLWFIIQKYIYAHIGAVKNFWKVIRKYFFDN